MNTFFRSSRYIFNEITALFDFLWPTAAAMWNLRWQVNGYLQVRPDASDRELLNRFTMGSNIHGANLKRACVELTWEKQQENFAKFLLVNIISLYESYISRIIHELELSTPNYDKEDIKKIKSGLQYPTSENTGIWKAINAITTQESDLMKNGFYQSLLKNERNRKTELDNLMICYRFFKECRNAFAHNGAIADKKVCKAYSNFKEIATEINLGVSEVPEYFPLVEGEPVHISLRGVVGLCDIILKIVVTLDAEFSRSEHAKIVFKKYWDKTNGKKYTLKTSDKDKRRRQIEKLINKLGLPTPPTPESIDEFEFFLREHSMVG